MKRRSVMKIQRTFICIAGVFFAVGFAASQAVAGGGVPGCGTVPDGGGNGFMEIEVNALRAGAKTIAFGANQSRNVTSKARILKGTAEGGTTIESTLTIEASDAIGVMSTVSEGPITLGVGKGGKGAKLSMQIPRCSGGIITFEATFTGVDGDNDACEKSRIIRKDCK
jgi:hypothetical protein